MNRILQHMYQNKEDLFTKYIFFVTISYNTYKIIQERSLDQIENSKKMDEITDLPSELFNPYRLLILSNLYRMNFLSFTQLKELTKVASDGNLASHLRYLENQKLIAVHKSYAGRYPKRFYELTVNGTATIEHIILRLKSLILGLEPSLNDKNEVKVVAI